MDIIILSVAIFLGYFVQTIVGFAASLIAFPILLYIYNIQEASAIMAILYVFFSTVLVVKNWVNIDKKVVIEVLPGLIVGMILGVYLLKFGSPIILKKALGLFIVSFVIYNFIKNKEIIIFKKAGLLVGLLSGIFGGLFSAGGPLLAAYIHNKNSRKEIIRATVIGCLGIINFTRIPLFFYSDLFNANLLRAAIISIPSFCLALWLGHILYNRINENVFRNIFLIILFLSGVSLIV
ncbi:MAG: sulfite exporter TauE/SafE family protein [Patescibacteria group bacterium]|nr:sulfite exporter TauE/SafE family protein [Patescibacteria group bacterium]